MSKRGNFSSGRWGYNRSFALERLGLVRFHKVGLFEGAHNFYFW